jgi:hypothetical protein
MIRDSALLPIVPDRLVQNYWKIERILTAMDRRRWNTEESELKLEALLKSRIDPGPLPFQQRESLKIALEEYYGTLVRLRATLTRFEAANGLALSNGVVNPDAEQRALAPAGSSR